MVHDGWTAGSVGVTVTRGLRSRPAGPAIRPRRPQAGWFGGARRGISRVCSAAPGTDGSLSRSRPLDICVWYASRRFCLGVDGAWAACVTRATSLGWFCFGPACAIARAVVEPGRPVRVVRPCMGLFTHASRVCWRNWLGVPRGVVRSLSVRLCLRMFGLACCMDGRGAALLLGRAWTLAAADSARLWPMGCFFFFARGLWGALPGKLGGCCGWLLIRVYTVYCRSI